jgi:hypothetical protein
MATGTRRVRTKQEDCGLSTGNWLRLGATRLLPAGKETAGRGRNSISLFGAVREKFYRRRRLVRTLAVTARIGKGTSCPVARLQNPP